MIRPDSEYDTMSAPHPTMAAMPFHFSAIEKST